MNFYSFIDIVETVGGIDMEVSKAEAEGMKKPMAEQNKYLKNKKGTDYISNDIDRKSTRLNSSHSQQSRMPSSA